MHHILVESTTSLLSDPWNVESCLACIYVSHTFLNKASDARRDGRDVIQIGLAPILIIRTAEGSSHCGLIGLLSNELGLVPDRVDLSKAALQLVQHYFYLNVFGLVIAKLILDAHSMESVLTGEDVELSIENGLEAEVTHLARVDRDMLVLLLPLLLPQRLSVRGMVLELLLERVNLVVVIIETITEMLLHVLDLLIRREQGQEIIDLELGVF